MSIGLIFTDAVTLEDNNELHELEFYGNCHPWYHRNIILSSSCISYIALMKEYKTYFETILVTRMPISRIGTINQTIASFVIEKS